MPFSERKDYFAKQILCKAVLIPLFFVLCTIPSPSALAATVNLAWDPSTGSNIAGYKIYYGTSSKNYSNNVNVGKNTTYSVSGLTAGTKYYFAATAYNTSNSESAKSSELTYTIPATSSSFHSSTSGSSSTVIIDNGASGTKASGTWTTSSGAGYYGSKSVYSQTVSSSYSFETARSGSQKVYLWWTTHSTRYSAVPVKIYDGSTLKATVTVNQLQNGGKWNLLGTYSFSGQAKVVIVSQSSSKTTCADAVQFTATTTTTSSGSSRAAFRYYQLDQQFRFHQLDQQFRYHRFDEYIDFLRYQRVFKYGYHRQRCVGHEGFRHLDVPPVAPVIMVQNQCTAKRSPLLIPLRRLAPDHNRFICGGPLTPPGIRTCPCIYTTGQL